MGLRCHASWVCAGTIATPPWDCFAPLAMTEEARLPYAVGGQSVIARSPSDVAISGWCGISRVTGQIEKARLDGHPEFHCLWCAARRMHTSHEALRVRV